MLMLSNISVGATMPKGTTIGTVALYDAAGASQFFNAVLSKGAAGSFYMDGATLKTGRANLPVGLYSIKVRVVGTATSLKDTGQFTIAVKLA